MNNIGSIIEEQVRKQGRSISWLAKQLSCHRTNIYDIFKRNNIDILLLQRLSLLLNYDFFKDLSDDVNPTLPFAPRFLRCISNLTMAVCVTVYYRFCLS